ncbi:MAG TPA: BadF/BadG/BcrA/BcrD ATPase family protein [Candidatus Acidoferrum sp.]|nr:BadF/BadG/BcrA/BcrD ATPase family protein [Candidatus Acidoferrum sp.]
MRFVLGFDGGGTKTDCVLADGSGKILARSQSGPSNPLRVGFGTALASVRDAARAAQAQAEVSGDAPAAICVGLAGAGPPDSAEKLRVLLSAEFSGTAILLCTDLDVALAAAGEGAVIVLLAGTGSFAVGRNAAGETARAGGYGSQIGDEGSAYDIGRHAVLTAMHEHDRTGGDSLLGQRLLRELACTTWPEVQARAQAASDEVFPRLFSVVAAFADALDAPSADQATAAALRSAKASAQGILRAAAIDLCTLAQNLAERLKLSRDRFYLAKTGGMMGRCKYLEAQLDERLRGSFPQMELGQLQMTPAEAAARMALRLLTSGSAGGR